MVSWFNLGSFLLLLEFYKLQGKINLFFSKSFVHQRLIREVFTIWSFCDAWCLNGIFYHIAAGTNLKNETTKSNNMSRTWHKWTETSHFTQSKVTISPTHSNEISRSNETSRCTRWPFRELSTMTYCGHASTNRTELFHSHSDPLRSQRKYTESVYSVAIAPNKCCCTRHIYLLCWTRKRRFIRESLGPRTIIYDYC